MAYTSSILSKPLNVCEMELFVRQAATFWDDEEREIYYRADAPLYLLMIYAKSHQAEISPDAQPAMQALAAWLEELHRFRTGRRTT
ncbi:MAG TPA: hypothetical protein VKS60_06110 [Stellaceae bacterium]|nr:hypothetical protein [Stellaceae bacterium]